MEKASSFFESIINDLGLGEAMHLQRIQDNWQRLFPPPMSLHTHPDFLKNSTLHINVDSHVWLQELHCYQGHILEKLYDYRIRAIKLRVGVVNTTVKGNTTDSVTFVPLNDEDKHFIDTTTAIIKDDELRAIIRKTMQKALSHPRPKER
ncbi:MAG: DUF721 domain-containing protein [Nitrospirae bacterium]|uniref:DUF721 domain-containing protein n=1 Tax=Candidatus Magnetobacterium casense TaxID=1455061 RepID=UPI00058C7ABA|nr:DUF721 domain-containing protein [Candidatus Magnetobacterium casensis]MBF0339185.1 DUF721 domain-containing protein [Nitrospirota bacterium]